MKNITNFCNNITNWQEWGCNPMWYEVCGDKPFGLISCWHPFSLLITIMAIFIVGVIITKAFNLDGGYEE